MQTETKVKKATKAKKATSLAEIKNLVTNETVTDAVTDAVTGATVAETGATEPEHKLLKVVDERTPQQVAIDEIKAQIVAKEATLTAMKGYGVTGTPITSAEVEIAALRSKLPAERPVKMTASQIAEMWRNRAEKVAFEAFESESESDEYVQDVLAAVREKQRVDRANELVAQWTNKMKSVPDVLLTDIALADKKMQKQIAIANDEDNSPEQKAIAQKAIDGHKKDIARLQMLLSPFIQSGVVDRALPDNVPTKVIKKVDRAIGATSQKDQTLIACRNYQKAYPGVRFTAGMLIKEYNLQFKRESINQIVIDFNDCILK